jgi:hypothetical protein
MRAGFSFTKKFVPTFKGNDVLPEAEQLVAELSMPNTQDLFAVLDSLNRAGFKSGEASSLNIEQITQLAAEAGHYVPKYVKLTGAEDFSIEDVIKYPPFFNLATELLFALVKFAQPTEDDVKNS